MRRFMVACLKFASRHAAEIAIAILLTMIPIESASSQSIIDTLRGGGIIPPAREIVPSSNVQIEPLTLSAPMTSRQSSDLKHPRETSGQAYCVRLCDGRYFPLARNVAVSATE